MLDLKVKEITNEVMGDLKKVEDDQLQGWTEVKSSQPIREYKTNMKEFEEAIGHTTKGMVQIPLETVEKLLRIYGKRGRDALSIYTFLQAKSIKDNDRFNTNNRPWAQREYCLKGLHMSRKIYDPANSILLQEGLKRNRKNRDRGGRFTRKDYVELPFINLQKNTNPDNEKARKVEESTIRYQKPHCGVGTTSTDVTLNISTDTSFGKPKKILSTTPDVKSDEVQHTTRYQKIPYGKTPIIWEGFEKEFCSEITEAENTALWKKFNGVIPEHRIRNRQKAFNLHLERLIANKTLEHIPTSRVGYLAFFANYLWHGEEMGANQLRRNAVSRMENKYQDSWNPNYDDGS